MLLITILIATISFIYYSESRDKIILEYKSLMQDYVTLHIRRLKWLHNHFPQYNKYPRDNRFNSAIYDLEYKEIFSTLKSKEIHLEKSIYFTKNYVIYVHILGDYYLGAKYLLIEVPKNKEFLKRIYLNIVIFATLSFIILFIIGYYLSKLFIKPMKRSIELLDNFIKDTTHEINTPISIINSNIEMLNVENFSPKDCKKLNRIKIASRTLEGVYKDLKFTTLETIDKVNRDKINLKELIEERIDYFSLIIESKKITINLILKDFYIYGDRSLYIRLIDNLISNAIKYNKINGVITIILEENKLVIEDSGVGIDNSIIDKIFDRYSRFNDYEGGFGLGLNIVKKIVDYYNLTISVESQKDKGAKFIIKW